MRGSLEGIRKDIVMGKNKMGDETAKKKCGHPVGYRCNCHSLGNRKPVIDAVSQMRRNHTLFRTGSSYFDAGKEADSYLDEI